MDFSPLNLLSAKLRLRIYELSLCASGDIIIVLEDWYHMSEGSHFIRPPTPQPNMLALTRTSKQIRHEALPVFLAQNHFKIYVHRAIGSASHNEVRPVAQKCFEYLTSFGRYASQMRHLDICMDEGRADGRIESLPKRCRLVRELRMLFGCTGPTMTVEMELSGGVTSERRPGIQSVIRQFRSVLPIKIELAHATDAENQHAIEMAVEVARRIAVSSGYPSGMYMNFLELRRRRALQVLEALSQGPARVTMAEDI